MRKLIVLAALAAGLAVATSASAGGWATLGIDPLPDGTEAGGTWSPDITIRQHGQTPLDGLTPVVSISDEDGARHEFLAEPAGEPGVYTADVTFPAAGSWHVVVESGFGDSRLTYGPVSIVGDAPGGGGSRVPITGLLALAATLALGAAAVLGVRRLRRLTPASD
jgi:YtkA-like protein